MTWEGDGEACGVSFESGKVNLSVRFLYKKAFGLRSFAAPTERSLSQYSTAISRILFYLLDIVKIFVHRNCIKVGSSLIFFEERCLDGETFKSFP